MRNKKYKDIFCNEAKNKAKSEEKNILIGLILLIFDMIIYTFAFLGLISLLYPQSRMILLKILYAAYREFLILCNF